MSVLLLFVSLGVILLAAQIFTNGIEWIGVKLNLTEGAVGSILAAVGTAMPESLIPLVAFVTGGGVEQHQIGIGAIIGAPFMLSTLGFFISGMVVVLEARRRFDFPHLRVDERVIRRDFFFFLIGYSLGLSAALIENNLVVYLIAVFLIVWYCLYVWLTLRFGAEVEHSTELNPLYFSRSEHNPRLRFVILQVIVGLALLIIGANLFVNNVEVISDILGVPPFILSLLIAPVATELPEKFNSVIWLLQGKDTLALGNITGAMVFQGVLLPSIGIIFTDWRIIAGSATPIVITYLSVGLVYTLLLLRKKLNSFTLLAGGLFYGVFIWVMLH
ncbi:MAG: sodium:calcium antiporter [Thermacetogeniaceae bacterium]|jgi:cation:H+ antiporter